VRFLADESCDFAVVRALRSVGHEVKTVADEAPGAPDQEVVELTMRDGRILITEDRDFGRLVFARGMKSVGVIYLRYPTQARSAIGQAVIRAVDQLGDRLHGKFIVLQPGRARVSD
jgi:predicted nuclease of predicted toxin-antitoxin system